MGSRRWKYQDAASEIATSAGQKEAKEEFPVWAVLTARPGAGSPLLLLSLLPHS